MKKLRSPRDDQLARHTPPDGSLEAELALLLAHSEEKQAVVAERLNIIDEYLAKEEPSVADVDEAAAKIGVSRRQFYRLLIKVRSVGPVRGLLPGFQKVSRVSAARDGLAEPIEALLRAELKKDPTARISHLQRLIAARCDQFGYAHPSEWQLRQRVHALRAAGIISERAQFGWQFVVDQVALDLTVGLDGDRYTAATFIIDEHTRLIAGVGVTAGDGMGFGLQSALTNMHTRIAGFAKGGFATAAHLKRIVWVLPPGLEDVVDAVTGVVDEKGHKVDHEVIQKGPRRHGDRILRLLGDKLGPYHFRTRAELKVDAERAPSRAGNTIEHAVKVVGYCVDYWNKRLLDTTFSSPFNDEDEIERARRLRQIGEETEAYFTPVLKAINARYPAPSELWRLDL